MKKFERKFRKTTVGPDSVNAEASLLTNRAFNVSGMKLKGPNHGRINWAGSGDTSSESVLLLAGYVENDPLFARKVSDVDIGTRIKGKEEENLTHEPSGNYEDLMEEIAAAPTAPTIVDFLTTHATKKKEKRRRRKGRQTEPIEESSKSFQFDISDSMLDTISQFTEDKDYEFVDFDENIIYDSAVIPSKNGIKTGIIGINKTEQGLAVYWLHPHDIYFVPTALEITEGEIPYNTYGSALKIDMAVSNDSFSLSNAENLLVVFSSKKWWIDGRNEEEINKRVPWTVQLTSSELKLLEEYLKKRARKMDGTNLNCLNGVIIELGEWLETKYMNFGELNKWTKEARINHIRDLWQTEFPIRRVEEKTEDDMVIVAEEEEEEEESDPESFEMDRPHYVRSLSDLTIRALAGKLLLFDEISVREYLPTSIKQALLMYFINYQGHIPVNIMSLLLGNQQESIDLSSLNHGGYMVHGSNHRMASLEVFSYLRSLDFVLTDADSHKLPNIKLASGRTKPGKKSITDEHVITISKNCENLRMLTLNGCHGVSDVGIIPLASLCNKITSLNLAGCSEITDEGIIAIGRGVPTLESVNFSGLTKITGMAVGRIIRRCSNLRVVNLNKCDRIDRSVFAELVFQVKRPMSLLDMASTGKCEGNPIRPLNEQIKSNGEPIPAVLPQVVSFGHSNIFSPSFNLFKATFAFVQNYCQSLDLSGVAMLADFDIRAVLRSCRTLLKLFVDENETIAGDFYTGNAMPSLKELSLVNCPRLCKGFVEQLVNGTVFPSLESLRISSGLADDRRLVKMRPVTHFHVDSEFFSMGNVAVLSGVRDGIIRSLWGWTPGCPLKHLWVDSVNSGGRRSYEANIANDPLGDMSLATFFDNAAENYEYEYQDSATLDNMDVHDLTSEQWPRAIQLLSSQIKGRKFDLLPPPPIEYCIEQLKEGNNSSSLTIDGLSPKKMQTQLLTLELVVTGAQNDDERQTVFTPIVLSVLSRHLKVLKFEGGFKKDRQNSPDAGAKTSLSIAKCVESVLQNAKGLSIISLKGIDGIAHWTNWGKVSVNPYLNRILMEEKCNYESVADLDLSECGFVDDSLIVSISQRMANLRCLNLSRAGCTILNSYSSVTVSAFWPSESIYSISFGSIITLLQNCTKMSRLNVSHIPNLNVLFEYLLSCDMELEGVISLLNDHNANGAAGSHIVLSSLTLSHCQFPNFHMDESNDYWIARLLSALQRKVVSITEVVVENN